MAYYGLAYPTFAWNQNGTYPNGSALGRQSLDSTINTNKADQMVIMLRSMEEFRTALCAG